MRFVAMGCLCAWALAAAGCADGRGAPTSPSAAATASGLAATGLSASPRSGDLRVTKECSGYTGGPGSFCRITISNVKAIEPDSKILYLQPDQLFTATGSAVVLDVPGPGNNAAFGRCSLAAGVCTFSGGTGKFTTFHARVDVTHNADFSLWFWEGTYSFNPQD